MVTTPVKDTDGFIFFFCFFLMRLIARIFYRFCLRTENKEKNGNIYENRSYELKTNTEVSVYNISVK